MTRVVVDPPALATMMGSETDVDRLQKPAIAPPSKTRRMQDDTSSHEHVGDSQPTFPLEKSLPWLAQALPVRM